MEQKKTILIIGAGKGLGNHIAKKFGQEGFKSILVCRNKNNLDNYIKEFKNLNLEVEGIIADCNNINSLDNLINIIKNEYKYINVLIYNAAIIEKKKWIRNRK